MKRTVALLSIAIAIAGCKKKEVIPVYQTLPVSRRDIVVSVNATGTVQPVDSVEIKSKASGEVMAIPVETGQEVKRGQLLLRVDPRNPRNALAQARANLEVAQAQQANALSQLKRAEELWATKSVTEQEYDNAKLQAANTKATVVKAQTDLENAKISNEDTDVKAPSDGIILTRNVGVGTVIQSATGGVSGGQILLKMANLDTVQVRALVDETDIGKLSPDMAVTITVDAYPNRPFQGTVQKIEPQSIVQQQVTMFPVMVRLPNPNHLLRPGMNAEIAITVGERHGVLAVQNSALRTQRDVASAAGVLGISMDEVQKDLAAATPDGRRDSAGGQASMGGEARTDTSAKKGASSLTINTPDGRQIAVPDGFSAADAKKLEAVFAKMRSGGGFQSLSDDDRALMQRFRQAGGRSGMGGGGGGGGRGGFGGSGGGAGAGGQTGDARLDRSARRQQQANMAFGGSYIVFVNRSGKPTAVNVRTGLTDLDYSEIVSGLTEKDSVMVLPSASLVQAQDQFNQMRNRMTVMPGMNAGGGGGGARTGR